MAHNETEIGQLLKQGNNKQAAAKLLAVLRSHSGNTVHAALALAVHHSTMKRWLVRLDKLIKENLSSIRSKSEYVSLSRAERNMLQNNIAQERDHARLLAWIGMADEVSIARIAKLSKVRSAVVQSVGKGSTASKKTETILELVSKALIEQRAVWREKRLGVQAPPPPKRLRKRKVKVEPTTPKRRRIKKSKISHR